MSNVISRFKEQANNNIISIKKEAKVPSYDSLERAKDYNNSIEELNLDSFIDDVPTAYLDYNFENNETIKNNINKYDELIKEIGNKWGINPVIIKSMMSIESAGKEKNLMQIQFSSWIDDPIKVHNFNTNEEQQIVLTNNPEKYDANKYIRITEKDLENPKTNISVATAILAKSAKDMYYNIGAAIQLYNMGPGNMDEILYRTVLDNKKNREELLRDQTNLDFTKHTNKTDPLSDGIVSGGDPNYLADVLKHLGNYVDNDNYELSIKYINDGKIKTSKVKILPNNNLKG